MKIKTIAIAFSLLVLLYQTDLKVSMQTQEDCTKNLTAKLDERPRFALIVDIVQYKNTSIPKVPGADKDAALIKQVLVENYQFPNNEQHIRMLSGAKAARAEIEKGFEFLKANAKANKDKNPIIVFYFSGHGTQYPNQDFDTEDKEQDGFDEAIVPWDSRDAKVFDILDDEIDDLSAELSQWSSDILYIFDSCNSGTASRGQTARETKPNPRNGERTPYKRKFKPSDTERMSKVVTLAAALPNEKARPKIDFSNGLMTFNLAAALRRASRTTTYQDLMREVRAAVVSENSEQHPFADGDEMRFVLGEASNRADPSIEILEEPTDGKIKFAAGKLFGVQPGTQVAIYDACTTKFVGKEGFLTYAVVEEVGDREAIAVLKDATKKVSKKSRLVLTAPTFGGNPVALLLDDATLAAGVGAEIRKILGEPNDFLMTNQMVELLSRADVLKRKGEKQPGAVLQLRRGKFGEVFSDSSNAALPDFCAGTSIFPASDKEIYYLQSSLNDAEAKPVPILGRFFSASDEVSVLAKKVIANIGLYTRQRNLRNLENINSALNDRLSLEIKPTSTVAVPSCKIANKQTVDPDKDACQCPSGKKPELKNGQIPQNAVFELEIKNVSRPTQDGKLYVGVLLVSGDGRIDLSNKDELQDELTTTKPFKFLFNATQPAGMEMIKVIITTKPEDLEGLRGLITMDTTLRKGITSPLEKLLNQSGQKTRGNPSLSPDSPDSWGVKTIEWTVSETKIDCQCNIIEKEK